MRAINHALTGAFIGLVVDQPALATAAAVLSHYVCDVIPHYGSSKPGDIVLKSKSFKDSLYLDAAGCFLVVLILAVIRPHNWVLAAVCAFLAAAPDLFSINRFLTIRRGKKWRPNLYTKFAGNIQWFERPIGGIVEIAWFVATISLLLPLVR